jgi:hypothetical protein
MKRELEVREEFAKAVSQAVLTKQRSRGTKVGLSWRFVQVVGEIQREIGEGQVVNRRIEPSCFRNVEVFRIFILRYARVRLKSSPSTIQGPTMLSPIERSSARNWGFAFRSHGA